MATPARGAPRETDEDGPFPKELTWHGGLADSSAYHPEWLHRLHELSNAARAGDFELVLQLLDDRLVDVPANAWRPGGQSLFTPLHHAAWHGVRPGVVESLVERGAWRNLPDSQNRIPLDIARERGHSHLLEVLRPQPSGDQNQDEPFERLSANLHALIESRIRPALPALKLRPLPAQALVEVPRDQPVWFPVPGMYGGFSVRLREKHLYVVSWSRVADGSGQAHIISRTGVLLIGEGFV